MDPWTFWPMRHKPPWCKTDNKPKPIPSAPSTNPTCDGVYQVVFHDLQKQADSDVYAGQIAGAATVDNENYLTYGLATIVDGCLEPCDKTAGCVFVNVYQDHVNNYPADVADLPESAQKKYAPGTLTCASTQSVK